MSPTAPRSLRDRRARAALARGTMSNTIARRHASATTVERHGAELRRYRGRPHRRSPKAVFDRLRSATLSGWYGDKLRVFSRDACENQLLVDTVERLSRDVLQLVVADHCNKEIALRLRHHEGSVERHVTVAQGEM